VAAVLLTTLGALPVSADSVDSDVRAARAAERTESIQLEQKLDAPADQVKVTVTETPSSGEAQARATAENGDAAVAAAGISKSSRAAVTRRTPAARSESPKIADRAHTAPTEASTAVPAHSNRPDKVELMTRAETSAKAEDKPSGSLVTVLLTILKLAVVLILAYLTILALKWFSARHDVMPSNNRQFKMVDTLRFNSTSSMHLVEIRGSTLLVGCTSGQVNVLKEFDKDNDSEADSEPSGKFAEYLMKYSDTSGKHGPSGRIAGLLRDCSGYLRDRCQGTRTGARNEK
jgi:flagellar biogenesis protein FliO